jgi:putative flippase GtrA
MKKTDAIISLIIGFLIGVFLFVLLKSVNLNVPFIQSIMKYSWIIIVVFPFLSLLGMLVTSILGKKIPIILQAGKFVLVGAFNTLIDLGILNGLMTITGVVAGFWYPFLKGTSFLAAVVSSYFWNKHWTFEKKQQVFTTKEFSKFLVTTTIGLFLNVGIASFVVNIIGPQLGIRAQVWATIGALSATLVAWVWNFLSSKLIVFKK